MSHSAGLQTALAHWGNLRTLQKIKYKVDLSKEYP